MKERGLRLALGAAICLLAAGCNSGGEQPPTVPGDSTTTRAPSAPTEAEVDRIAGALSSGDADAIAAVLDLPDGVDEEEVTQEMLPAGVKVTLEEATFVDFGDGRGVIEATVSGAVEASVFVYLRQVGGEWKVSGTSQPAGVGS